MDEKGYINNTDCTKYGRALKNIQALLVICFYSGRFFSVDGININELCQCLKISDATARKRFKIIDENGYVISQKVGKYKYYAFDTKKLNG